LSPGSSAGKVANNGIIIRSEKVAPKRVTDGTSNTIMIGESAFGPRDTDSNMRPWIVGSVGDWIYNVRNMAHPINAAYRNGPKNPERSDVSCGSEHSGGAHFAFADGSVRFVSDSTEMRVLYAVASRGADETLPGEVGN
jgi:prepilin-type processing-associated H-X9-DG protein